MPSRMRKFFNSRVRQVTYPCDAEQNYPFFTGCKCQDANTSQVFNTFNQLLLSITEVRLRQNFLFLAFGERLEYLLQED